MAACKKLACAEDSIKDPSPALGAVVSKMDACAGLQMPQLYRAQINVPSPHQHSFDSFIYFLFFLKQLDL